MCWMHFDLIIIDAFDLSLMRAQPEKQNWLAEKMATASGNHATASDSDDSDDDCVLVAGLVAVICQENERLKRKMLGHGLNRRKRKRDSATTIRSSESWKKKT